jgi:multiple sugar transport system ATP-binding protein
MNLVANDSATVGFRPEHLLPAGFAAEAGPRLPLSFRLDHEEYLGSERILYGRLEDGRFDGKVVSRVPASYRDSLPAGSAHPFEVVERNLKFFDGETGVRRAPVALV